MLRNFLKNRKAQNTAEYALLIALVVAGVIAMQTYAQRALQARVHDASVFLAQKGSGDGTIPQLKNSVQYEPYYTGSDYNVQTNSIENKRLGKDLVGSDSESNRTRFGNQVTNYDKADKDSATL